MAPKTRTATTTSREAAHPANPSPPNTRKRAHSAADNKKTRKKNKPTITVEQELKGGRGGRLTKGQNGQKGPKKRCVAGFFFFLSFTDFLMYLFLYKTGLRKPLTMPRQGVALKPGKYAY